jgi:mRNA degradation ribonuclease J1/J2
MKKVILVSGRMRSGKNQFSEFLKRNLINDGLKVFEDLFARSLKDGCKEDFLNLKNVLENISEEIKAKVNLFIDQRQIMLSDSVINDIEKTIDKLKIKDENWYEDKTDITRSILQLYGTEIFRRRVDNNYWVKQVKDRCISSNDDVIIITDCRFPNEITEMFCDDYETIVVRIIRNINTNEHVSNHASETALDNWKEWSYIVENNGTLDDLKGSASVITEDLTKDIVDEYEGLFTKLSKENLQFLIKDKIGEIFYGIKNI